MVKAVKSRKAKSTKTTKAKQAESKGAGHSEGVIACVRLLAEHGATSEKNSVARKTIWAALNAVGGRVSQSSVQTARNAGLVDRVVYDKSSFDAEDTYRFDGKFLHLTEAGNKLAKSMGFKLIKKTREAYLRDARKNDAL